MAPISKSFTASPAASPLNQSGTSGPSAVGPFAQGKNRAEKSKHLDGHEAARKSNQLDAHGHRHKAGHPRNTENLPRSAVGKASPQVQSFVTSLVAQPGLQAPGSGEAQPLEAGSAASPFVATAPVPPAPSVPALPMPPVSSDTPTALVAVRPPVSPLPVASHTAVEDATTAGATARQGGIAQAERDRSQPREHALDNVSGVAKGLLGRNERGTKSTGPAAAPVTEKEALAAVRRAAERVRQEAVRSEWMDRLRNPELAPLLLMMGQGDSKLAPDAAAVSQAYAETMEGVINAAL